MSFIRAILIGASLTLCASNALATEVFFATATPSQELHTPAQTTKPSCIATFRLTTPTNLNYRIYCYNINRINMAHVHFGSADANGGVRFTLYSAAASDTVVNGLLINSNIVRGSGGISEATFDSTLTAMREDNTYFNLHTSTSAPGEVRGQIVVMDLPTESTFLY